MKRALWALAMAALVFAACDDPPRRAVPDDAGARRPRVFAPPPGEVRPVPPHAIRARGVGPYVLGEPLKDVLSALRHGPRVELLKLRDVVDYSLVRAEDGGIIVGVVRPDGVAFVAVVDGEVARTESGVGVGSTTAELAAALGPEVNDPARARDPRMKVFAGLPNVTFVMSGDAAAAVVVTASEATGQAPSPSGAGPKGVSPQRAAPATSGGCPAKIEAAVRAAAGLDSMSAAPVRVRCAGAKVAAAVADGDQVIAVSGTASGKLRRVAAITLPGLVSASLLEAGAGFPPEIAAVTRARKGDSRETSLTLLRPAGGALAVIEQRVLYKLSETAWMAAKLEDTDLMIELSAHGDEIDAGGLYVHWQGGRAKTVAPLLPDHFTLRARPAEPRATDKWPDPDNASAHHGSAESPESSESSHTPADGAPPPAVASPGAAP
ncbi:MAG TPA: hypothetical protein VFG83_13580 [Kofleriaceae bacterium]|nr:hypothetical protein [Kofleriaceae bacterium]